MRLAIIERIVVNRNLNYLSDLAVFILKGM